MAPFLIEAMVKCKAFLINGFKIRIVLKCFAEGSFRLRIHFFVQEKQNVVEGKSVGHNDFAVWRFNEPCPCLFYVISL